MSRSRQWLLAAAVLLLAGTAVRLGVWQTERLVQRRAANALLRAARAQPPIDLGTTLASAGRRAVARGHFETTGELLLRSRVHRAAPGLHVVSPFRLDGAGSVWVLRGFVPAADGVQPNSVAAADVGTVEIRGELQALPNTDDRGQPVVTNADTTWRRLDALVAGERRTDAPPLILYLEGGEAGPGRLAAVEPPQLDDGPHLSYALQWFAIALAILVFGAYALRKPIDRERAPPAGAP